MRLFLICFLVSISVFSQEQKDSIAIVKIDSLRSVSDTIKQAVIKNFYSDQDLKIIDSLLVNQKFNSALIDTLEYVINDKDIIDNSIQTLTSALLKNRLAVLNENTPFNLAYNPALEKVINSYLVYRKKYYPALMAKAKYYFPMFEQHLDQYDIPLEMKYLSIVESALKPRARSGMGASGLWQFMYGTGKEFDLKVSSYVDERYDPVKATIAACKYLSQLYGVFGDWDLALAAYNSGPGNVRKAIKRSGGYRNYWNIRPYLPRETAGYVPAFYATMYIFEYAKEHNIYADLPEYFNFQTDTVHVKRTISFDQISEIINVDEKVLAHLNPSYKLDIIPYLKDKNYVVRLPSSKVVEFLEKEKELYELANADDAKREKPLPKYFEMDQRIRYKVKSGDYLGKIANKFGVRVSSIKSWNRLKSSSLKIGQRLYIYPKKLP
ncbi:MULTISPECIES: lytic transglycosylase domain-containing protein [unclassified Polaribacter]|uniref:lytic transglycosylase domain-containing protein n=1 Tax=unclassified Polaribacter TaxID=196858 RepID=UPI0011BF6580|nr:MULTISPECIES: lytic transglycosylase domain-containing protein [unclassified Polaribacter]TXD51843.1 LysM peptidoglycan-binding domain-containing protein [Polaribacter sp. IC063]TXD59392.1 LysM peptidoglycan-binding domain-containing protein [Polaribacter sp. IC066]